MNARRGLIRTTSVALRSFFYMRFGGSSEPPLTGPLDGSPRPEQGRGFFLSRDRPEYVGSLSLRGNPDPASCLSSLRRSGARSPSLGVARFFH